MDSKLKLIADSFGRDKFKFDEPLSEFTTLKVGGPAKLFFVAFTLNEIIRLVNLCKQLRTPLLVFGTGSKIMISDHGFNGVVIKNRTRGVKVLSIKGKVSKIGVGVEEALIEVESGLSMSGWVDFLKAQGLQYEEFVNIPGSIGGNLFLNLSLQRKVESVKVLNQDSKIVTINIKDLKLNYDIILSCILKIKAK